MEPHDVVAVSTFACYCECAGRMTLLLGPPGAGKTTLLTALAGKLQHGSGLQVGHKYVIYNLVLEGQPGAFRTATHVEVA